MLSHVKGADTPPLLDITIGQALTRAANKWPDNDAVISVHQNIRLSYADLLDKAQKMAVGLLALGVQPGERLGIWAGNCAEWTITQFATALSGIILVNINPDYRPRELKYALNKVGCKALVMSEGTKYADYQDMVLNLQNTGQLPDLQHCFVIGSPSQMRFAEFQALFEDAGRDALAHLESVEAGLRPHDAINIQFTSGTTGAPKGATLSHRNILNNGYFTGLGQNFNPLDRLCLPVPLYHCFGMVMGTLACCVHGSTAVYASDKFEPQAVLKALEQEKCTAVYGVPTMFIAMLEQENFGDFNLSSLRTGTLAGSPCPIEVMKKVITDMNMTEVTIGYGMTETSPLSFQTAKDDPLDKRVSTVGKVHPHVEVKIIDETGQTTNTGVKGELCTRGYSVMHGYWNDKEKTAEAIDENGWMHTGDLAVIDEDGYCDIVGRVKDMLIRGGENIFPREIEDFLFTHPDIIEAQVFGVPDAKYGEAVCAWIRLAAGAKLTEETLQTFCKGEIAHYKIPQYVRFVDAFPLTVTGKIQKNVMREMMSKELRLNSE